MPYTEYEYNDELYHYGVLGMKWGVRKDRNNNSSRSSNSSEGSKKLINDAKEDAKSWESDLKSWKQVLKEAQKLSIDDVASDSDFDIDFDFDGDESKYRAALKKEKQARIKRARDQIRWYETAIPQLKNALDSLNAEGMSDSDIRKAITEIENQAMRAGDKVAKVDQR